MIPCSHCHENAAHCSSCVTKALRISHERRCDACNQWHDARQDCWQYFQDRAASSLTTTTTMNQQPSVVLELQAQSEELRNILEHRRKLCSEWAVRVCEIQVANEERRNHLMLAVHQGLTLPTNTATTRRVRRIDELQSTMQKLQDCIIDGLDDQLDGSRNMVCHLRWQWALTCFNVYRLQIDDTTVQKIMSTSHHHVHNNNNNDEDDDDTTTTKQQPGVCGGSSSSGSMGIGKICSLPLPNVGSELLGVLPQSELQSALRYTAALTQVVARCLAIPLPHPIRVRNEMVSTDIAITNQDNTASTATFVDQTNKTTYITSTGGPIDEPTIMTNTTTTTTVAQRIQLATNAWIYEAPVAKKTSCVYQLTGDCKTDEFQIAWQFLQHDILSLCFRAGVPVSKLSSGEAVLVNLFALQLHCQAQHLLTSKSVSTSTAALSSSNQETHLSGVTP